MVHKLGSGAATTLSPEANPRQIDQRPGFKNDDKVTFIYHDRGLIPVSDDRKRALDGCRDALHMQDHLKRVFARRIDQQPVPTTDRRLLLLENIHDGAVEIFKNAGFSRITRLKEALDGTTLHERLHGVSVVGIRSRTQLELEAIAAADQLLAIGCFGVGTNQVDIEAARMRGIPVFNAPFANTRSVAELVIGEIVMLFRQIFPRSVAAHSGDWQKNAAGSCEIRGKVLGIVGYGNIGTQLSHLAETMGMKVIYFDINDKLSHGNAERASGLADLLGRSDVVSLHVPEAASTSHMIGKAELAAMRQGSYLINNSRGTVVDIEALANELRSGRLAGAAIDVFPEEPSSNSDILLTPLRGLANVILTPHIGGSTEEAQERIGVEVARKLSDFMACGSTVGAVNFPQLKLTPPISSARFAHVHRKSAGMVRSLHDVFRRRGAEMVAHYYQADDAIGYAVIDGEGSEANNHAILGELSALEGTICSRLC
jgi:D-3-phosphoglycerate dehydrogenase / 2-oxoglutarate reductase